MTTLFPPTLNYVPVGFRFRPTDEELVKYYLKNKLLGNDFIVNNVIAEVDVFKFVPWDLPACSAIKSDDPEWFFLCPINYKYAKSKRIDRTTKNGFWKATGKDRNIKIRGTNEVIGIKKTLVYHEDSVPVVKTNWIIHEYHDATFDDHQRTLVLCRLISKAAKKICDELGDPIPSTQMTTSFPFIHDSLPVGFRFCPTGEELVHHYLRNKLLGNDAIVNNVIAEVDICKFEPSDLSACSAIKSDDPEWFFLCPINYKYAKSKRIDRTTKNGFWKATGKDRNIKIRGTNEVIGIKKTLVYHEDSVPVVKTNWIIHEYHDATFDDHQRTFVLCHLMKKAQKNTEVEADALTWDEGEQSIHMSLDYENQETVEEIPDVSGTLPEINMESIFEEPYQVDNYFPFSTRQCSIYENEPGGSFSNSEFQCANFRNEDIVIRSPFETIEEENKFVNSMFVDRDFVTSENSRQS
uniref:NAC family transcription factor n=1 Tax=Melilotus albus TaxID=47082 RepID=A0A896WDB9_MELAB|nr:NAC family transcription factor [Melilotus albus]